MLEGRQQMYNNGGLILWFGTKSSNTSVISITTFKLTLEDITWKSESKPVTFL
jgi:hypothetical protein